MSIDEWHHFFLCFFKDNFTHYNRAPHSMERKLNNNDVTTKLFDTASFVQNTKEQTFFKR